MEKTEIGKDLNTLMVLSDKTGLYQKREGFLMVRKEVEISGKKFDLGFSYTNKPKFDRLYYPIPIISYSMNLPDEEIFRYIRNLSELNSKKRFLIQSPKYLEHVMLNVNGDRVSGERFYLADSNQISERVPDFANNLKRIEEDFDLLAS